MHRKYVYKKKSLIILVTLLDNIGYGTRRAINLLFPQKAYSNEIKKILIIKLDHAGDVLLSTPVIESIRKSYPKAFITLVAGPWNIDIVKKNPDINEVITYNSCWHNRPTQKSINLGDTYNLIKYLRKNKYDLFFDLRGDVFSIILASLSGIPRRIGYPWEGGGCLLTDEVRTSVNRHQVQILMDSIRILDKEPPEEINTKLVISEKDRVRAGKVLDAEGFNHNARTVGFHIGAGCRSKCWEPSRYAQLMNILVEKFNLQILILGGHDDECIYESIKGNLNFKAINTIGKTGFSETAALIEKCSLFIGNDSAPVHVAAAVGTPVVVIFSAANDFNRWKPYGRNVFVITKETYCMNCEKTFCDTMDCMKAITVEEVAGKIEEIRGLWNR